MFQQAQKDMKGKLQSGGIVSAPTEPDKVKVMMPPEHPRFMCSPCGSCGGSMTSYEGKIHCPCGKPKFGFIKFHESYTFYEPNASAKQSLINKTKELNKGNSKIPERKFTTDLRVAGVRGSEAGEKFIKLVEEYTKIKGEKEMSSLTILGNCKLIETAIAEIKKENDKLVTMPVDEYHKLIDYQEKFDALERATLSPVVSKLDVYKKNVCSLATRTFGNTIQTFVAAEEMGELIQALSKDLRGQGDMGNVVEEIVDVSIMLEQLKIIYDVDKEVLNRVTYRKLTKLQNRINDFKAKS